MYSPVLSICFRTLRFAAVLAVLLGAVGRQVQGQTKHYLEGQKTGNYSLVNVLGPGTAGLSSPMQEHRYGLISPFKFYYGPSTILNGSTTHSTQLRAAQDIGIVGGTIGVGANAYIMFRNTNNTQLSSGITTYFTIEHRPTSEGISLALGGLLGLVELQNIQGRGHIGAGNYSLTNGGAPNEGTPSGTSAGTLTQFLIDQTGKWYIAVTPDGNYNAVRLDVRIPEDLRIVDVARSINVSIYNAFTESPGDACSVYGRYTSPGEATGITLNTGVLGLEIGQLITNPHFALNDNPEQFASYSSGIANVGIANTVSQTIYFDHVASSLDGVNVRLGLSNSLIGLGLLSLNGINFKAYLGAGDTPVWQGGLGDIAQLLNLDLLNLINIGPNHSEVELTFKPGVAFDRIKVELNKGLLDVGVIGDALRVYHIKLSPLAPEISDPAYQPADVTICENETAAFSVTASTPPGSVTSYEWQYSDGGPWIAAEGVNHLHEYTIPNTPLEYQNRRYRVAVTGGVSGCEQTIYSREAALTVIRTPGRPHLSIADVQN